MPQTIWRARVGARVGGFGVPGGCDATSGQRRLKGFVTTRALKNALIAASGPKMNAGAHWLVRNNGYAAFMPRKQIDLCRLARYGGAAEPSDQIEREFLPGCTRPCRHYAVRFGAEVLISSRKWLVFTPPLTGLKIYMVIPPFSTGCIRRIHAAIFSFCAGVMRPMPRCPAMVWLQTMIGMFGRSLL